MENAMKTIWPTMFICFAVFGVASCWKEKHPVSVQEKNNVPPENDKKMDIASAPAISPTVHRDWMSVKGVSREVDEEIKLPPEIELHVNFIQAGKEPCIDVGIVNQREKGIGISNCVYVEIVLHFETQKKVDPEISAADYEFDWGRAGATPWHPECFQYVKSGDLAHLARVSPDNWQSILEGYRYLYENQQPFPDECLGDITIEVGVSGVIAFPEEKGIGWVLHPFFAETSVPFPVPFEQLK